MNILEAGTLATQALLPESKLNQVSNVKTFGPFANGKETVVVKARYDDTCKNGHNSLGVTCDIYENRRDVGGGCNHELIEKLMPEMAPLIKWHLVSTDGPLHYIANTLYWVGKGELQHARNAAVWPEAGLEDLTEANLLARLPTLMREFKREIESWGFEY